MPGSWQYREILQLNRINFINCVMDLSLPANNKTEFVDLTDACASGCNQAVPECSSPFDGVSSCGVWSRVFGDVPCCQAAGSGSP
jgi:hypothetical protein